MKPLHTTTPDAGKRTCRTLVLTVLAALTACLSLTSCGPDGKHCAIEGRFLKMNQGQFLLYSPDGVITGVDTISVMGGRFEYEAPCTKEGIMVLVLPNFTELPVFVSPGKAVDIKADATHVRDVEITGTEDNKRMTEWRKEHADMMPENLTEAAEKYIRENPRSNVSKWLLYKYILNTKEPDYKKAKKLADLIMEATKKNPSVWMSKMTAGILSMGGGQGSDMLPKFTATDINGKTVTSADYMKGYVVITAFSMANYDSQNVNRLVNELFINPDKRIETQPFKAIAINIDASKNSVRESYLKEGTNWRTICDGKMWDSPLVEKLGFHYMPDNIVVKDGRIIARNKTADEIGKLLKK